MIGFHARLAQLGFGSYADYLRSPHWFALRQRWWRAHPMAACFACREGARDLHHQTYERLGAERLSDLVGLCRECHELHHERERAGLRDLAIPRAPRERRKIIELPLPPLSPQWARQAFRRELDSYRAALRGPRNAKKVTAKRKRLERLAEQAGYRVNAIRPLPQERQFGEAKPWDEFARRANAGRKTSTKRSRRTRTR